MIEYKIGRREEWLAAREELLEREKEHKRLGDELARRRREWPLSPSAPVKNAYGSESRAHPRSLSVAASEEVPHIHRLGADDHCCGRRRVDIPSGGCKAISDSLAINGADSPLRKTRQRL
jgi:hypothetical protein